MYDVARMFNKIKGLSSFFQGRVSAEEMAELDSKGTEQKEICGKKQQTV